MKGNVCVCQRKGDCGIVAGGSVFLNFTACNISTKSKHLVRAGYFHFISALTLSLICEMQFFLLYIHSFILVIHLLGCIFLHFTHTACPTCVLQCFFPISRMISVCPFLYMPHIISIIVLVCVCVCGYAFVCVRVCQK